jgi:hypothetical protein
MISLESIKDAAAAARAKYEQRKSPLDLDIKKRWNSSCASESRILQ